MIDSWDKNARARHEQLLNGTDITFSHVLAPFFCEIFSSIENASTSSLLEIGCGTGVLTRLLAKKVQNVTGIDPSLNSINIAREYNLELDNINFKQVTLAEYSETSKQKYDIVVAHMVLHVIEELSDAFSSVVKLTNRPATLIFSIPHPCFYAEVKSDFATEKYEYSREATYMLPFAIHREQNPLESKVPYVHRPLATYFNALEANGILTRDLFEPFPNEETMKLYNRRWKYPGFLIFKCLILG